METPYVWDTPEAELQATSLLSRLCIQLVVNNNAGLQLRGRGSYGVIR